MKLSTKLIAAPLATAVVALAAGGAFALTMQLNGQRERRATSEDIASYRALGTAQGTLGTTHANVYRTLAILNSFDQRQLEAFAAGLRKDLDGVRVVLAKLAAGQPQGSALRASAETLAPLLDDGAVQTEGFDVIHRALRQDASQQAADAVLRLVGQV